MNNNVEFGLQQYIMHRYETLAATHGSLKAKCLVIEELMIEAQRVVESETNANRILVAKKLYGPAIDKLSAVHSENSLRDYELARAMEMALEVLIQ